jgi:hypothetical protein
MLSLTGVPLIRQREEAVQGADGMGSANLKSPGSVALTKVQVSRVSDTCSSQCKNTGPRFTPELKIDTQAFTTCGWNWEKDLLLLSRSLTSQVAVGVITYFMT